MGLKMSYGVTGNW